MLTHDDLAGHLRRDAPALDALLSTVDRSLPVTGCPGWTVGDLAAHLGSTHRWVTEVLHTGAPAPQPDPEGDPLTWYARGWPPLLAALAGSETSAPCWGMGPPPRVAGFWTRRMAHETAFHLLDVQRVAGLEPTMPATLAADGVAEVAEVFAPRQIRLGRCAEPSLAVSFALPGSAVAIGSGQPAATVSGEPLAMLELLWRQRADARLSITGDPAAVTALLALPIVP